MKKPFERYVELQNYIGWSADDANRMRAIGPVVAGEIERLIDDFYSVIERHAETRDVIVGGIEQTNRLKATLADWLRELLSGTYDHAYVERRWRVGRKHVEIGLNQVYTNAALSRLRHGLLASLAEKWTGERSELFAAMRSLGMLLDLDLAIIEDAYQAEYQRRQAIAERFAAIGKTAGGIAHELRNPLNVVRTSVYFLLNAKQITEEKRRTHLERIERQVAAADSVITALNDFARLPLPQLESVEIAECLRLCLEQNPPAEGIEVQWPQIDEALRVLGDRSQLAVIFGNLLRNARDAMPTGGCLRISAVREGDHAAITVTDTGTGIAPEHLPYIFEPLYSTKAKGMGLGLAISREIASHHRGSLTAASDPVGGTAFTLRIPALPPGEANRERSRIGETL